MAARSASWKPTPFARVAACALLAAASCGDDATADTADTTQISDTSGDTHSDTAADGDAYGLPDDALDGPDDALANAHLPPLFGPLLGPDDYAYHPGLGVDAASRHLIARLSDDATVGAANAALAAANVRVAGSLGAFELLLLELPADASTDALDAAKTLLAADPAFDAVAYDLLLGLSALPEEPNLVEWGPPADPNWALEHIRAPQAWNLRRALDRDYPGDVSPGVPDVVVAMIDGAYQAHAQLDGVLALQAVAAVTEPYADPTLPRGGHATKVAGNIAGTWTPRARVGGVSPWVTLLGYGFGAWPYDDAEEDLAGFWNATLATATALTLQRPRVVNLSLGMNWHARCYERFRLLGANTFHRCDPTGASPDSECDDAAVRAAIADLGRLWAALVVNAQREAPVLFVLGAGNDAGGIVAGAGNPCTSTATPSPAPGMGAFPAQWSTPMNWAAINVAAAGDHSIVVEAHTNEGDWTGARWSQSNVDGGGVAAPGVAVGVLAGGGAGSGARLGSGTSYATPFVTGAAAFLVAVEPSLTNAELRELLTGVATTRPVQAPGPLRALDLYAAVLGIDALRGGDRVKRMLADVDDGTADGFRRVRYDAEGRPVACVTADGPPDGEIDLADVRRFRDARLLSDGLDLDGPGNPKRDLNEDGAVRPAATEEPYARFALNGDDKLDGRLAWTPAGDDDDLWVLRAVYAPDAQQPWEAGDLAGLMRSADLLVSGECVIDGEAAEAMEVRVTGGAVAGDPQPGSLDALSGLGVGRGEAVLTTPLREDVRLRWRAVHGDGGLGEEHTVDVGELAAGEDRVVRLDPLVSAVSYEQVIAQTGSPPIVQRAEQLFVLEVPQGPASAGVCAGGASGEGPSLREIRLRETFGAGETRTVRLTVWSPTAPAEIYLLEPLVPHPETGELYVAKTTMPVSPGFGVFPVVPEINGLSLTCGERLGAEWEACLSGGGFSVPAAGEVRDEVDGRPCRVFERGLQTFAGLRLCLPAECEVRRLPLPLRYETWSGGVMQQRIEVRDLEVLDAGEADFPVPQQCLPRFGGAALFCDPP